MDASRERTRNFTDAGFHRVDSTVACVLTRFRLRSALLLPLFVLRFRRVRKEAREKVPGLIAALLLVEGPRTCCSLSLWENEAAIVDFGTYVRSHVPVAGWGLTHTRHKGRGAPEIWSTQWRLWGVSRNLNWRELDHKDLRGGASALTSEPQE
jgi:hypothetical protein